MTALPANPPDPVTVRCPTCRAAQEWSDVCRRCRSDLRLLRDCALSYATARRVCLQHLQAGHFLAAREMAYRCHALAPSAQSRGLLAVAMLQLGDWSGAATLAAREQHR